MSENRAVMHVLSHTHWDREWYQDFQGFRQRLVFQMDSLLDLMEQRPEYRHFHMDGQTSCLLDYLEIHPEKRDRLTKLIQDGRILIGPWFVMPDELLLNGESMIRNLLYGGRICDEFGADPMPIGYVTDIFGHCSQFPQILDGFGIDAAILQRGTSGEDGASELVWEGADGTEILLIKCFPYGSYGDFYFMFGKSDDELREYEQRKLDLATTPILFGMDGSDHLPALWTLPEIIEKYNGIFTKIHCIHSSIPTYLHDVKEALGSDWKETHKRFKGEIRLPNKTHIWGEVFQGTGSSRAYLKQANDKLEYILPRYAEPLHVWSLLMGGDDQKAFLDLAWRYFLTNHPHDSMVGCSVDKVHSDMMYRFAEASSIAWNSIWESIQTITDRIDTSTLGEGLAVTAFNLSTADSGPVTRITIEIPQGEMNEKRSQGLAPVLIDSEGKQVRTEIESTESYVTSIPIAKKFREENPKYWMREDFGEVERINAVASTSIPSTGYNSWRIDYIPKKTTAGINLPDGLQAVTSGPETIENEFISLSARPDGLVDLLDKTTGTWYHGLHELEDCGDTGHGWDHMYPQNDTVIRSTDAGALSRVAIKVRQPGLLTASIIVDYTIKVPAGLTEDRTARASKLVSVPVQTIYTLDAGSHRVNCRTTIDNNAKNHRMRVILPTGRSCDTWFCDTAFDLLNRDVKLFDTTGWAEKKREESPVKNLAAACDEKAGLAILTKGLCEACVQDNDNRSIALTLFRGFSQSIGGHWTSDSQMQGKITFEYALLPFTPENNKPPVGIYDELERYKMPPVSLTTTIHKGDMPSEGKLMDISGDAVISTIKASEDGKTAVVRLFNPYSQDTYAGLTFYKELKNAWTCNMAETTRQNLDIDGSKLGIPVPAKKVVTIKVEY